MSRLLKGSVTLHFILIVLIGLFAYSNTFHAPFQWDEKKFIEDNSIVKDLAYFLEPSKAKGLELYGALKSRYIGYLTFALNYRIHGTDVTGYHVFNVTVHILNALLVYLLTMLTFKTPFLAGVSLKEHSGYIALFTGLLFVSHPVQTEAVTYIFQRLASLMAFFYLLSVTAYIGSRLSAKRTTRYTLYALSLISALLAMKTKENAFTLPLAITLYEFLFFTSPRVTVPPKPRVTDPLKIRVTDPLKIRLLRLAPFLLTMLVIPLAIISVDMPPEEIISRMEPASLGRGDISREEYVFTGFRVIVTYIRLLFLPVNQNIDYDYPVFNSFFNPQVFLSFLFLLSIFCYGVHISIFGRPVLRVVSAGIFWFFLNLYIESSTIVIPMVINEYRVYLPSAGAFLAAATGAFLLLERVKNKRVKTFAISFLILIPLVFSYAAYARNSLWKSEISLWEDVVRKSPGKARGHNNLGVAYKAEGLIDKAIEQYRIALTLQPDYTEAHNNLGVAYEAEGLIDKAIEQYRIALTLRPNYIEVHNNLGNVYKAKGLIDKAIEQYRIALTLRPDYAEAHYNTGIAYKTKGLTDRAIKHYKIALRLNPDYAEAHNNLGLAYESKGLTDRAIKHYRTALRLKPDYLEAHFNLGLIHLENGALDMARREFETVLQINPASYQARQFLDYISDTNKTRPQ